MCWGHLGIFWASCWDILEVFGVPKWGFAGSWAHFVGGLGLVANLWRFLDALWELFGSTLGILGVALGRLGDVFGALGEHFGNHFRSKFCINSII